MTEVVETEKTPRVSLLDFGKQVIDAVKAGKTKKEFAAEIGMEDSQLNGKLAQLKKKVPTAKINFKKVPRVSNVATDLAKMFEDADLLMQEKSE